MTLLQIALVLLVSMLSTGIVLAFCLRERARDKRATFSSEVPISYLFEDDQVIHASPLGQRLLRRDTGNARWEHVREIFASRFPTLPRNPPKLGNEAVDIGAVDPDDPALLRLETIGRHTRFELVEDEIDPNRANPHILQSVRADYKRLEFVTDTAPFPMWRLDANGDVIWSNTAYQDLTNRAVPNDIPILKLPKTAVGRRKTRQCIELAKENRTSWFDIFTTETENGLICHATNIDAVIEAEIAQRNFVQTLAKTFAHLSTGLAIFDRNRQLVLFNPALIDLTGLQADFLSARPEMLTFFDNLRDRRVMPEPKNYANWREDVSRMIEEAADGRFEETWSLHSGQTYRVTGRPHPDGAIAFLIEDISSEVSLTRNFRAELELSQALIDSLDEAIAVFSPSGVMTFCNAAYRMIWRMDPDKSFADTTVVDCLRVWQELCQPNPALGELREFTMKIGERAPWTATLHMIEGQEVQLYAAPLASGASVVRFSLNAATEKTDAAT